MFRRLILSLVCLALPMQAIAAVVPQDMPCPMESMSQMQGADAEEGMRNLPDCCNDEDTFARTGEPCKTGHECTVPTSTVAPALIGLAHAAPLSPAAHPWSTPPPIAIVATPWRPPSSL